MEQQTTPISPEESARIQLQSRCNEAIGADSSVLSEVLSYFPDDAELFIKTQQYASQIEGKKGVWYTVKHTKPAYGVTGKELYSAGQWEHLGVHGFTGEALIKAIRTIEEFRGKRDTQFYGDSYTVSELIRVARASQDELTHPHELQLKKVVEVMGLTEDELTTLGEYVEAESTADDLGGQISQLRRQIEQLEGERTRVRKAALDKVEALHPAQKDKKS